MSEIFLQLRSPGTGATSYLSLSGLWTYTTDWDTIELNGYKINSLFMQNARYRGATKKRTLGSSICQAGVACQIYMGWVKKK